MTIALNIVVAGDPEIARKLRDTGRFPAVFHAGSATQMRALSRTRRVGTPAAFLFAPDFHEDLPGAGVSILANRLSGIGFTVLVHTFFTERGDTFAPGVVTAAAPMNMSDLLAALGVVQPEPRLQSPGYSDAQPDLHPEPPPALWSAPR